MHSKKLGKICRVTILSAIISGSATGAFAQELNQTKNFNISQQSLSSALLEFSEQSGIQVAVNADVIQNVSTPGLVGSHSQSEALTELLGNSGLSYTIISDDTVAISKPDGSNVSGKKLLASNLNQESPRRSTSQANSQSGSVSSGEVTEKDEAKVEKIAVVGSKIANMRTEAALPVAVYGKDDLDALGPVDGNELVRAMPQMGDVTWNESYIPHSSNAARGDMGSMNLKNLGASSTLLLINGRRSVIHPTTSTADNGVSSTTFNSNAIPMYGLDRVEVLLDGAAAIYGSDAIAGVVNIVTQENLDGAGIKVKYGSAEGTGRSDTDVTGYFGTDFDEGKGNVSVMYNLSYRTPQKTTDTWYTATMDRRDFLADTDLSGTAALDGRSTYTPWGTFTAPYQIYSNGNAITSAAGVFHTETGDSSACAVAGGTSDTCYASGSVPTDYRYDTAKDNTYVTPRVKRANVFTTFNYNLTSELDMFGELGVYVAESNYNTFPGYFSSSQVVYVPATAYYNPLGSMYLADGSLNPNRIAGLDNVSEDGVAIRLSSYRFSDVGNREVNVDNMQTRALLGIKGWTDSGFDWESAVLFSQGDATDESEVYDMNLFVEAISGTTADAFNPFWGGDTSHITYGGTSNNSQATMDSFTTWSTRKSRSQLASWDFKVSHPELMSLPAGDLGFAAGVEVRYESLKDDRDAMVDGSDPYVNWYTGESFASSLAGSSPSPDSYGSRNVKSAYVEFALPLVAPDFNIPLVKSLDMQLAGRYESYSDVGDITTPKVAVAWGVVDSLTVRGSWSEGFKAPNLEVLNAAEMSRFYYFPDYIFCEADVRNGDISNYSECSRSTAMSWNMAGNSELKPETSENQSVGFVFAPQFIPKDYGRFKFTFDMWKIQVDDQIGIAAPLDVLINDVYLRTIEGSSDERIVRADPTADDLAVFEGTGLEAAGEVLYMQLNYANLNSLKAEGMDFSFDWRLANTEYGSFSFNFAASRLTSYEQALTPEMQRARDALNAGLLDDFISITSSDEVGKDGLKPEWKASTRFTWNYQDLTWRLSAQYTGSVLDGKYASGANYEVPSVTIWNTSAQYEFGEEILGGIIGEIGVRNMFDKEPPLNSSGAYLANLYLPYARYVYASIEKRF